MRAAAGAAALALENGRLEVELRARVEALRASRARASSRSATPSGAASGATCTTARSSG